MSENGNDKKTIYLYAVILFTCAFIVLLLTAYSQTKFSKSEYEYKNLISNEEKAKINFKTNLNTALEENKRLTDELEILRRAVKQNESTNYNNLEEMKYLEKKLADTQDAYKIIVQAQDKYIKGNIKESALLLKKDFDKSQLDSSALQMYEMLVSKTFKKAALQLYTEGYKEYLNKSYSSAALKFRQSIILSGNEYFTDDCYFFLAYAEYRLGNNKTSEAVIKEFVDKFPDSNFKNDMEDLLNLLIK